MQADSDKLNVQLQEAQQRSRLFTPQANARIGELERALTVGGTLIADLARDGTALKS